MNITAREENGITIIEISGKMDTAISPAVHEKLVALRSEDGSNVLLNLSRLDYMSSAGLRALLALAKQLEKEGGALRICNLNKVVQEVFEIAGFNSILKVFPSESEALASF